MFPLFPRSLGCLKEAYRSCVCDVADHDDVVDLFAVKDADAVAVVIMSPLMLPLLSLCFVLSFFLFPFSSSFPSPFRIKRKLFFFGRILPLTRNFLFKVEAGMQCKGGAGRVSNPKDFVAGPLIH